MTKSIAFFASLMALALAFTAPSALAHEFKDSPEKSGFIGKGETQTITLGSNKVTCKAATIGGAATTELLYMEVKYESCEAFSKPATVSGGYYTMNANGTGGISKEAKMTIVAKPPFGGECIYTLPETPTLVSSVNYANSGSGITIESALKGLTYELKEVGTIACGMNGEKSSNASYEGKVTTESFEAVKCLYLFLGAYLTSSCLTQVTGFYELFSGYSSLKWS